MVSHWLLLAVLLKQMGPNANGFLWKFSFSLGVFLILKIWDLLLASLSKLCGKQFSSWATYTLPEQGVTSLKEAKGGLWFGGGEIASEMLPTELITWLGYF